MPKNEPHIKKHKRKYIRFFTFFFVIYVFRLFENYLLFSFYDIVFNIDLLHFLFFAIVAAIFTVISEVTEKILEKEEHKLENIIKRKLKMV